MRPALRPTALNALVYLVFSRKELWVQRLGDVFRKSLKEAGLTVESKVPGGRTYIRATDAAWDYLADEFPGITDPAHRQRAEARPCNTKAKLKGEETLDAVLAALQALMRARGLSLEEVLRPAPAPGGEEELPTDRVVRAYLTRTRGEWHQEVRLSDLRALLSELPRGEVDAALVELWRARRVIPYPIENPRELRAEDEAAALRIGDNVHHCIRMKEA